VLLINYERPRVRTYEMNAFLPLIPAVAINLAATIKLFTGRRAFLTGPEINGQLVLAFASVPSLPPPSSFSFRGIARAHSAGDDFGARARARQRDISLSLSLYLSLSAFPFGFPRNIRRIVSPGPYMACRAGAFINVTKRRPPLHFPSDTFLRRKFIQFQSHEYLHLSLTSRHTSRREKSAR